MLVSSVMRRLRLHQTVEFRLEGAAVLVLFGVDFLHPLLEVGDVVLQRLQNDVERLFVDILELARLAFEDVVGGLLELEHQHLVLLLQLLSLFVEPGRERFDVLAGCHEVELPCAQARRPGSVLRAVSAAVRASSSPMRRDCACSRRRWDRQRTERMPHAAAKNDSGDYQKDLHIVLFRRRALQSYPFFRKLPYLCANVLKRHGTHYLPFYAFGRLRPPRPRHEDD